MSRDRIIMVDTDRRRQEGGPRSSHNRWSTTRKLGVASRKVPYILFLCHLLLHHQNSQTEGSSWPRAAAPFHPESGSDPWPPAPALAPPSQQQQLLLSVFPNHVCDPWVSSPAVCVAAVSWIGFWSVILSSAFGAASVSGITFWSVVSIGLVWSW